MNLCGVARGLFLKLEWIKRIKHFAGFCIDSNIVLVSLPGNAHTRILRHATSRNRTYILAYFWFDHDMKTLLLLPLLFTTAACALHTSKSGSHPADNTLRYCRMTKRGDGITVHGFAKSKEVTTIFSFTIPDKPVVSANEIKNYTQDTRTTNNGGWSGGGVTDGFLFINQKISPNTMEVHFLQKADCSCRHIEPYFANGIYVVRK